ncbi:carbohydrate porin [Parabacteroides timonensis]|uniref:carbohydrate porin n=1 Tax=Parabacteroides timonensis TaxID=1871013 RepID=UPI000A8C9A91|nr:carbohydrate porin [Parabacteroides timonensis]
MADLFRRPVRAHRPYTGWNSGLSPEWQDIALGHTTGEKIKIMKLKRLIFFIGCTMPYVAIAQTFSGEYTTEWQWNMKKNTNWVNLLRLEMNLPIWRNGSLEAATIHVAKTNECIIDDWQTFSNIEEDNNFAAIALLGYMHTWKNAHLFLGVRNVNEDFFTSDCTSLFTSSSCGIFPTISASYPVANYPLSGLTVHFDVTLGGWTLKNSLYNGKGYNGWKRHDNPFLVHFRNDGIFNMTELSYRHEHGNYFAGTAVHDRIFPNNDEEIKTVSCAWWIYGEQSIWKRDEREICLMAQYSENTDKRCGCRRYAELGCVYTDGKDRLGLSGQHADFLQGKEWSVELTWQKTINENLTIQPIFQYIRNGNGDFSVLSARLHYSF